MQWKLWVIWKLYVQLECTWKFHIAHMRLILKLFEYTHIFYVLFWIKIKYLNPIKLFQEEFKCTHQRIQKPNTFWLRKCIHCVFEVRDFLATLCYVLWLMVWNEPPTLSNITIYEQFVWIRLTEERCALSYNDLNGLVLDEIYLCCNSPYKEEKTKMKEWELNQAIPSLMGSKHDYLKCIISV